MHGSRFWRGRVVFLGLVLFGGLSCPRPAPLGQARSPPTLPTAPSGPRPVPPIPSPVGLGSSPFISDLEGWIRARLPRGGRTERDLRGALRIIHVTRAGDSIASLAHAYIDLTTAYTDQELAAAIAAANHLRPSAALAAGLQVSIPRVVDAVPAPPAESRLGWPGDAALSGIYAHIGMIGAPAFPRVLDRLAASGMNAVVVDGKTYGGWLTYRSVVPLAVQTKASSHAVLPSLERLVRAAHARGIRVVLRVSCFHDEWMAAYRPDLAVRGVRDWLNPNEPKVQDYLLAVVDEVLATGVDEIQLDYVRYPTEGLKSADFALGPKKTTEVIAGFVSRVHERTAAAGVPLSLDLFGVVAWQRPVDVRATGQDLTKLGPIVEAISPMVYPSHFAQGSMGFSAPGQHPEVVGYGTKQAVEVLKAAGARAVVRPWIQAFSWRAPDYDQGYVSREIESVRTSEGVGWLAWNAGGFYGEVFAAAAQPAARIAQARKPNPAL